jgi:hypothetical protein
LLEPHRVKSHKTAFLIVTAVKTRALTNDRQVCGRVITVSQAYKKRVMIFIMLVTWFFALENAIRMVGEN